MTLLLDLDFEEIRSILSLYHLEKLVSYKELFREKYQALYRVDTGEQEYFLRVCLARPFGHLVFEKDLLKYLDHRGLPVPIVEENVASGAFTPWSVDGRYVSLFRYAKGRTLGRFEFGTEQCTKVGEFLGGLHDSSDGFSSRSSSKNIVALTRIALKALRTEADKEQIFSAVSLDLAELESELEEQETRLLVGEKGIHHGGIKISSLLFHHRELTLVRGFSDCGHDRLIFDLAKAIYDCCWIPDPNAEKGPAGSYDPLRINAMIQGYRNIRNPNQTFWGSLGRDLRLFALVSAVRKVRDFELSCDTGPTFEDYRHDMAKLRAVENFYDLELEF